MTVLFNLSLATILLQIIDGLNPLHLQGAISGMSVGAIVGAIMWPLVTQPDSATRIMLGGIVGAIIQGVVESIRMGQNIGSSLRETVGSTAVPEDAIVTQNLLVILENMLLAISVGAIIVAIFTAPTRAVMGVLLGIVVGALAGFLMAMAIATQLPLDSILFRGLVALVSVTIFFLTGRQR